MSNAAVIVNKILRMRSALSREETGSGAAVSCKNDGTYAARYQWEG